MTIRDPSPPVMASDRSRKLRIVGIVALIAIATGLAGVLIGRKLAGPRGLTPLWPSVVEGGAAYRRVTYHSQPTWNARLANNGRSVIYSTSQSGKEQVMRMQIDTPSIADTGIVGRLVDISPSGALAVLTDDLPGTGGTLSRVVEGAGPRPVSDRVTSATWLPDETLAAIREELSIEAPLGTVIVKRTAGKLAMLRASRDGTSFAFASHAASGDTQGHVVIVDRSGTQIAMSSEQAGIEGIAWAPDGNEVWFSNGPTIFALDRSGKERVVLRGIIRQVLVDIDAGKILVAPSDVRLKMFTGPRRGGTYRDVGWFDASEVDAVSRDGATIAFVEAGGTGFTKDGYAAFLRGANGLASQLTNAHRVALLPDASAAIVVSGDKLVRVPTGVGKPARLSLGPIQTLDIGDRIAMAWSGKYVVIRGAEAGKSMRLWRIDLGTGEIKPISGSSASGRHPITPDGELVAIARATGGIELQPIGGGAPRVLEAAVGEEPLSFHGDGTALFTLRLVDDSIAVDRIDLASGARESWLRITPEQRPYYFNVVLSADGEVVTYSTNSHATDLYVLEPPAN